MLDIIDTPRGKEEEFSKSEKNTLHVIWNVDTVFLLCGAEMLMYIILLKNKK